MKMANDLNNCNFIGRLGQEPEIRLAPSGDAIANFSIAVSEQWKDKNSGQKQEKTTWVPVVIFGKLAEVAGQYLQKGSQVFVSGKFQVRKWQDQQGNDRYNTEIVVDNFNGKIQMLGGNQNGQQPANNQNQNSGHRNNGNPQNNRQQGQGGYQQNNSPQKPQQNYQQQAPNRQQNFNQGQPGAPFDDMDDDIPF